MMLPPSHVSFLLLLLLLLLAGSSGKDYDIRSADDGDPCWDPAKIDISYCPKGRECGVLNQTLEWFNVTHLQCADGFDLRYKRKDAKVADKAVEFKCDIVEEKMESSVYRDEYWNPLPIEARVYCLKRLPPPTPPHFASTPEFYYAVAGGIVVFALLIVLLVIFIIFLRKHLAKERAASFLSTSTSLETSSESATTSYVAALPVNPPHPKHAIPRAPDGPKGAWLKRERGAKKRRFDRLFWTRFNETQLTKDVMPNFARLSFKARKKVFYTLTALHAYAGRKVDRKAYGHLHHFFELLRHAEAAQMDSTFTWESIFRFVRLLEDLVKKHIPNDTLNIVDRLRSVMRAFARPILEDLGWKIRPEENITDTHMRFLVVRVLLWTEAADVIEELTRQADLPLEQLESPLRAVVLGFAARQLKRGEEMRKKHWTTVMEDPKGGGEAPEKLGTLRQHLLFGLATYRDEANAGNEAECRLAKEMLESLYCFTNLDASFTPADHYWAFLGATEHASNVPTALAVYSNVPKKPELEQTMVEQMETKIGNKAAEDVAKAKEEWKTWIVDTADMLAECCAVPKQYADLSPTIERYEKFMDEQDLESTHDNAMFVTRCTNLERLFAAKTVVADIFNFALKKIEPGGLASVQEKPASVQEKPASVQGKPASVQEKPASVQGKPAPEPPAVPAEVPGRGT